MFDARFFKRLDVKVRAVLDSIPLGIQDSSSDSSVNSTRVDPTRLVTLEFTNVPKELQAQFNMHRALSASWQSARAKPVKLTLEQVETSPYLPAVWTRNQRGMQGDGEFYDQSKADYYAQRIRQCTIDNVQEMERLGIAKQDANRYLAPFTRANGVFTGTTAAWVNFFLVRATERAQPAMAGCALLALQAWRRSQPTYRIHHLPYVAGAHAGPSPGTSAGALEAWEDEALRRFGSGEPFTEAEVAQKRLEWHRLSRVSAARCARVSYKLFDGTTSTESDERLASDLIAGHEVAPFQHPASWIGAIAGDWKPREQYLSNYAQPWVQYRKVLEGEAFAGRDSLQQACADVMALDIPDALALPHDVE